MTAISTFAAEPGACRAQGELRPPQYPELAKRMKIYGVVRLELHLAGNGSVHEIKVLGGNPVLVSAAEDAVRRMRFEGPDTCLIVFQFRE